MSPTQPSASEGAASFSPVAQMVVFVRRGRYNVRKLRELACHLTGTARVNANPASVAALPSESAQPRASGRNPSSIASATLSSCAVKSPPPETWTISSRILRRSLVATGTCAAYPKAALLPPPYRTRRLARLNHGACLTAAERLAAPFASLRKALGEAKHVLSRESDEVSPPARALPTTTAPAPVLVL